MRRHNPVTGARLREALALAYAHGPAVLGPFMETLSLTGHYGVELSFARWEDVDMETGRMKVRRLHSGKIIEPALPPTPRLVQVLASRREQSEPSCRVFDKVEIRGLAWRWKKLDAGRTEVTFEGIYRRCKRLAALTEQE